MTHTEKQIEQIKYKLAGLLQDAQVSPQKPKIESAIWDCFDDMKQALTSFATEREEAVRREEREKIVSELLLKDYPNEDGGLPVYTAPELATYLKREHDNFSALPPSNPTV